MFALDHKEKKASMGSINPSCGISEKAVGQKELDACYLQTSSSLKALKYARYCSRTLNGYCTVRVRFVELCTFVVVSVAVTTTV
jgi:hypothetical protein